MIVAESRRRETRRPSLPPVGPTSQLLADPVVAKFKTARAEYLETRVKARSDLFARYQPKREEIQNSNLDANEKDKSLKRLTEEASAGSVFSHPAMQDAVADYWRALTDAALKFGGAADEGLAAYKKAGVTDPARIQPLLAARTAAPGMRTCSASGRVNSPGFNYPVAWVIDFDERTGGLQVAGMELRGTYRGQGVEFKDGVLSFVAVQVDPNNDQAVPGGVPRTMTLEDGKLRYELQVSPPQIFSTAKGCPSRSTRQQG